MDGAACLRWSQGQDEAESLKQDGFNLFKAFQSSVSTTQRVFSRSFLQT